MPKDSYLLMLQHAARGRAVGVVPGHVDGEAAVLLRWCHIDSKARKTFYNPDSDVRACAALGFLTAVHDRARAKGML